MKFIIIFCCFYVTAKALSAMPPGKIDSTTTATKIGNATTDSVQVTSHAETSTDDAFMRQIEDLSTAKMRYKTCRNTYLKLSNGKMMPSIGLGTALMDNRVCPNIVCAAIEMGYRAFDTAYIYGTEKAVGEGLQMKIDDGTVKREELFISGKLWSTFHAPHLVKQACRDSLKNLGLDYFDLYMIHNPMSLQEDSGPVPIENGTVRFSQYDYMNAWTAMEDLVKEGLVKSLGISNFNSVQINNIIDHGIIKPVVLQVECHPYLTQQPLQAFCNKYNIILSCFSVLGSKGTPAAYKTGLKPAIDDPLIRTIAKGLQATPGQLLVAYQIASGRQAIVKASSAEHLWDILQAYTMKLEPNNVTAINALNRDARNFDLKMFGENHRNYPFNIPY